MRRTTEGDRRRIRTLRSAGIRQSEIAERTGFSQATVSNVLRSEKTFEEWASEALCVVLRHVGESSEDLSGMARSLIDERESIGR